MPDIVNGFRQAREARGGDLWAGLTPIPPDDADEGIRPDIERAVEALDAAVFSGDAFHGAAHRALLRDRMAAWEREFQSIEAPQASEGAT